MRELRVQVVRTNDEWLHHNDVAINAILVGFATSINAILVGFATSINAILVGFATSICSICKIAQTVNTFLESVTKILFKINILYARERKVFIDFDAGRSR